MKRLIEQADERFWAGVNNREDAGSRSEFFRKEMKKASRELKKSPIPPKLEDQLARWTPVQAAESSHAAHFYSEHATTPKEHATAGRAHLEAAQMQKKNGNEDLVKEHKEAAAKHAAAAGGEWDEEKHPRDENGKFA